MTKLNSEHFRKNYPHTAVPDTQKLQQNILAATEGLEQEVENKSQLTEAQTGVRSITRFFDFLSRPVLVGLAASIAMIAITVSVWSPILNNNQDITSVDNANTVFDNGLSLSELSADELEFQELILLEDELMFAQL
jgi:hypothetical protein